MLITLTLRYPLQKLTKYYRAIGLRLIPSMTEALPKLPVLVVDDSPLSRRLLEHPLSGDSYSLVFVENGNEALQLFKERRPAIVITYWMLPDCSGPELCQRIRADSSDSYTDTKPATRC